MNVERRRRRRKKRRRLILDANGCPPVSICQCEEDTDVTPHLHSSLLLQGGRRKTQT